MSNLAPIADNSLDQPLNNSEQKMLGLLEAEAGKCLREAGSMMWQFARHLQGIRDQRLYREVGTWEEYCQRRFGFRAETCNKWIRASEVSANLSLQNLIEPTSESQTRPLQRLTPDQQASAWQIATHQAEGQPTQRQVAEAVDVVTEIRAGVGVMLHEPPPHMLATDVWAVIEVQDDQALISLGGEPLWMPLTNIRAVIERIPPPKVWEEADDEPEDPMVQVERIVENLDVPKAKPAKPEHPNAGLRKSQLYVEERLKVAYAEFNNARREIKFLSRSGVPLPPIKEADELSEQIWRWLSAVGNVNVFEVDDHGAK